MNKINVLLDKMTISRSDTSEIKEILRGNGLDTSQPFERWVTPTHRYSVTFYGIALPRKVVRIIKTCIGVIPTTEPWPGEMGVG